MLNRWNTLRAALAAVTLVVGAGPAGAVTSDGLSLRAVGFFEATSSGSGQSCSVPTITEGVLVNSGTIGLWNTFGIPTIQYPDDVCKGWMELQNVMIAQGVSIETVDIRLKIAGAGRFRQYVPTRNGWPTACRQLRKATVFTGAHLFPFGTDPGFGNTGSGQPNVAFVNLFPMVSAQVIQCLREQYASLPSDVYVTFPLVIRAVASGITDSGQTLKSNPLQFTLNLLHLCGNGRIEAGEQCDPNAPNTCNVGPCDTTAGTCDGATSVHCQTDADCSGSCLPQGDPMECNCLFN
jgi:hypothetical protein